MKIEELNRNTSALHEESVEKNSAIARLKNELEALNMKNGRLFFKENGLRLKKPTSNMSAQATTKILIK